eukprot:m.39865 g.39865  ORF g.39865 m.39865 type:complete len:792 (+) comp9598_c0_seq2:1962-4337(+)
MADNAEVVFDTMDTYGKGVISSSQFNMVVPALRNQLEEKLESTSLKLVDEKIQSLVQKTEVSKSDFIEFVSLIDKEVRNNNSKDEKAVGNETDRNRQKINKANRYGTMGASIKLRGLQSVFKSYTQDGSGLMPAESAFDLIQKETLGNARIELEEVTSEQTALINAELTKKVSKTLLDELQGERVDPEGLTYSEFVALFGDLFTKEGKGIVLPKAIRAQLKALKTAFGSVQNEKMVFEDQCSRLNEILQKKNIEIDNLIMESENASEELEAEVEMLRKNCQDLSKANLQIQKQSEDQLEQKSKEMEELASQICDLQFAKVKHDAKAAEALKLQEQVAFLDREAKRAVEEREKMERDFNQERRQWATYRKEVETLMENKTEDNTSVTDLLSKVDAMSSENQDLKDKLEEMDELKQRISQDKAYTSKEQHKCEDCEKLRLELSIEKSRNEHSEARISELQQSLGQVTTENENLKRKLRELEALYDKLSKANATRTDKADTQSSVISDLPDIKPSLPAGISVQSNMMEGCDSEDDLPDFVDEENEGVNSKGTVEQSPYSDPPPSYTDSCKEVGNPFMGYEPAKTTVVDTNSVASVPQTAPKVGKTSRPHPGPPPKRTTSLRAESTMIEHRPAKEDAIRDSAHLAVSMEHKQGRGKSVAWFQANEKNKGSVTDTRGYIWSWFHGVISRNRSEELIRGTMPGTFLIRVSESRYGYVLTLNTRVKIMHFIIEQNAKGQYGLLAWHGDGLRFMRDPLCQTLGHLVAYFSRYEINTRAGRLKYPCEVQDEQTVLELFNN